MRDINAAKGIVPLGEFKANASRYLKQLGGDGEPLVITQNGRPAAVVLAPSAFEELRQRQAYLEAVAEGLAQAETEPGIDHEAVQRWLESWGTSSELEPPK